MSKKMCSFFRQKKIGKKFPFYRSKLNETKKKQDKKAKFHIQIHIHSLIIIKAHSRAKKNEKKCLSHMQAGRKANKPKKMLLLSMKCE